MHLQKNFCIENEIAITYEPCVYGVGA